MTEYRALLGRVAVIIYCTQTLTELPPSVYSFRVVPRPEVSPVRWWRHEQKDRSSGDVRPCYCATFHRPYTAEDIVAYARHRLVRLEQIRQKVATITNNNSNTDFDWPNSYYAEIMNVPGATFAASVTGDWISDGVRYHTEPRISALRVPGFTSECMASDIHATWTELFQQDFVLSLLDSGYIVSEYVNTPTHLVGQWGSS